ncbi:MAG: Transcriptional regulator, TetR family [Frankiales bacterium]|jgi:AcrR family transcriptional regulator|nr:Transcriptional regulator, TetR family [Frankiales bacterium]
MSTPAAVHGEPRRRGRPPAGVAEQTRLAVLDAAVACFADQGYGSTSLRTIAERAGLTAGSVYHHFPSKQALYHAAYLYAFEVVYLSYEDSVVGRGSLLAELNAMLDRTSVIMETNQAMVAFISKSSAELSPRELGPLPQPVPWERFRDGMVHRAVERGELTEADARLFQRVFATLLWGLSSVGLRDPVARAECVEGLKRLLAGTLVAKAPPPALHP